jgi:hypothetical protein
VKSRRPTHQLALHEAEVQKTVTHVAGLKCYLCSRLLTASPRGSLFSALRTIKDLVMH